MKLVKSLLAAFIAAAAFGAQATDYIKNGSFESTLQAEGSYGIYTSVFGWIGTPDIEVRNSRAGEAYDGENFVELDTKYHPNGSSNSGMYQEFLGSGLVDVSFWYSARPRVDAGSNGLFYSLINTSDNSVVDSGSFLEQVAGGNAHNWSNYSTQLDLGSTTTKYKLMFSAIGTAETYGGSLDKVSITSAVPEPESYAMMLAGLGLMGAIARRRKAKAA